MFCHKSHLWSVMVRWLEMESALPSILNQSRPCIIMTIIIINIITIIIIMTLTCMSRTVQSSPEKEKNFSLSLRLVISCRT